MMPVIAWNALHASTILRNSMAALRERCVDGIAADRARARELLDRSTATATALSPYIGYAATAEIAKESVKTGRPIRDLVLERGLLDAKQLDEILSVEAMTRPGIVGAGGAGNGRRGWQGRSSRCGQRAWREGEPQRCALIACHRDRSSARAWPLALAPCPTCSTCRPPRPACARGHDSERPGTAAAVSSPGSRSALKRRIGTSGRSPI